MTKIACNFDDLSQMGESKVTLVEYQGRTCIRKQGANSVETGFYQFAASELKGVNTPKLVWLDQHDLYLEFIPRKVSLEQLVEHKSVFKQLSLIHQSDYQPTFPVKQHRWQLEDTEFALATLGLPDMCEEMVRSIQACSADLFGPSGLISGDSNDGNWGVRDSGELVLFDWERFGFGSPAIDLAPLVKGMGSLDDYLHIIEKYLFYNSSLSDRSLLKQLIIAKMWIAIEVTNLLKIRQKAGAERYFNWYRMHLPMWLNTIENSL